jgi:uncharacterized surface protein with fasciclin (FAS1) repeats
MFRHIAAAAVVAVLAASLTAAPSRADIVSTVKANASLSTLAKAIETSGLAKSLEGDGPFTLFAPNDAAFAKLPKGTLESLMKPGNSDALIGILTYHIVADKLTSQGLAGKKTTVESVEGSALTIDGTSGLSVGDARVVTPDVAASNGVIHIIDTVLAPE